MRRTVSALLLATTLAACGATVGTSAPASDGVRSLVQALRSDDPHAAYELLSADALHHKDLAGALALLTSRRRDGIARQIEGFVAGLDKRIDGKIEEIGTDRAELRWDENGIRFRVVLRKEDDEWRIDDIVIHPTPEDEAPAEGSGSDKPPIVDP